MNNLNERIKQAKSLNTGIILDREDVKHLKVGGGKKDTPLNRMLETDGRRLVVCGYCGVYGEKEPPCYRCPIQHPCSNSEVEWSTAPAEDINQAYEILTKEEQA